MIISLLKFVKQYIVKSYKSIIKFINNMFLLIVVFVLGLFNNFKSYLKSLYLKKNNKKAATKQAILSNFLNRFRNISRLLLILFFRQV